MHGAMKSEYGQCRTFDKMNLSKDFRLQQSFTFTFAGNCNVFINASRKHYNVCRIGYDNVNGIIMFNHDSVSRVGFKTLYQAIQYFIYEVNLICSDLDWYKPDLFNADQFYEFANARCFE